LYELGETEVIGEEEDGMAEVMGEDEVAAMATER
jgi:hypothetical protein